MGLKHLNRNLLASVVIKTTGPNPLNHEIAEIVIMPLNNWIEQDKSLTPLILQIKPNYPDQCDFQDMDLRKADLIQICKHGMDKGKAADHIEEWFDRLNLPKYKKIAPLAYNWPRTYGFILNWLGPLTTAHIFDYRYRDILPAALFVNDYADAHVDRIPNPKLNFTYLCSTYRVERDRRHDIMIDCLAVAEIHRIMIRDTLIR